MAAPITLRLVDPQPDVAPLAPSVVHLPDDGDQTVTLDEHGTLKIEHGDGSATFDFNPDLSETKPDESNFFRNIANEIDSATLSKIASDLITGIEYDEDSRKEWLATRARGIGLLGLKLEEPRGDTGTSSAPLEGMSSIRHPLLLEATIRFQATARGELLPAAGPVKVRNDATPPPEGQQPPYPSNGGPALEPSEPQGEALDELGNALEKDMNHYLTVTATEYVPDTDRMLFYVGFGGDGFKKVYNCPLRRRPVSESVDAENVIVSNAATDIRNCGRVTHKIKMRPSILRRMQIVGAYRDVSLTAPTASETVNPVDQKKAEIAGHRPQPQRPEDADYTVFECYCELDIDKFSPKQFKGKALPLPYVVTLEKESRQVLEVRRNWDEADEQCLAKQFFVQFPFIRALGFYGIGLIHILGNVNLTLTAVWREFIDSGMFANFPGFLFAKGAGRQLSNQMRVPAGGGLGIDVPPGMKLSDAVMPIPYKEPGPAFTSFITHVEEVGQRLGQTADISIGEGKQEAPVGTTMALIEQATKVMDSVHKRLHAAQAEEFGLLKERFREDPEAFWRHNKKPSRKWKEEEFKKALESRELVPVADPNNPTSLHRIAKTVALLTLAASHQQFFNISAVLKRVLRMAEIDAEGLLNAQPSAAPPDPRLVAIQAKAAAQAKTAEIQQFQAVLKAKQMQLDASGKAEDRASRERIHQMQLALEQLRLQQEAIIHAHDIHRDNVQTHSDITNQHAQTVHQFALDQVAHQQELAHDTHKQAVSVQADTIKSRHEMEVEHARSQHQLEIERERGQHALEADRAKHEQSMRHADEKHAADLEHKRALARVAAKPKSKPKATAKSKTGDK